MKKRKMISFLAILVLVLSISVTIFAQIIAGSIREIHEITLNSDLLKVKTTGAYADYVLVSNGSVVSVDKYQEGYDLIALSEDRSDGIVLASNRHDQTYPIPADTIPTDKNYYAVALMHHEFNRYISSQFDLELLNNEYRHQVVNDDMFIGNATDLFNHDGDYIGNLKQYDLINGIYDYKGDEIKSIIDVKTLYDTGAKSYELDNINSSLVVNLNNFRRNDFYNSTSGSAGARATGSITLTPTTKLYDAYGRLLKQIYYIEAVEVGGEVSHYKEWNYVFTKNEDDEDIIILNGNVLEGNATIDLSHSYYEDGVVVYDSYNSKTFKNIYLLKSFSVDKNLSLIMPCNFHMLNNDINLNANLEFKHYYHGNFIFDNLNINGHSGSFIQNDSHNVSFVCPNATFTSSDLTSGFNTTKSTTKAEDVMDFLLGYIQNRIIDEGYTKAVSYTEGEVYYTRSGDGIDNPYIYTIDNTVTSDTFDPDAHYVLNLYSIFAYNPILPRSFYDEKVTISYEENGDEFVVERENDNTKHNVLITVSDDENVSKRLVHVWVVGTNKQAIVDSIAKELEYRINKGFESNTNKIYFNYDAIESLFAGEDISFKTISGLSASIEYLKITNPLDLDNGINIYVKNNDTYDLVTTSVDQNETYYAKYLMIHRASYSFSSNSKGILEMDLTYNNGNDMVSQNIISNLSTINELLYQEHIINEIGQIFFTNEQDTYELPSPSDLVIYDVKNITYQPKMKLSDTEYINVPELSVSDYIMSNGGVSNVYEYYVEVVVTLNDDSTTTFMTPKIIISASSTGGDGENEYRSSLFQQEFNAMSIFIGKSETFKLDGNMYFYLKITNESGYEDYIGLYRVIESYDKNATYLDGSYFYIDENLNKVFPQTIDDIDAPNDPNKAQRPLYTLPSDSDDVKANYKMVFLTNSDNITTNSNVINVKAYITDNSGLTSASDLIEKSEAASSIDLYEGIYDANHNPIYELSNGREKYVITYERDYVLQKYNVTNVKYTNSTGEETTITNGDRIDISGFYCDGFVYSKAEEGQKLYIKNGLFKNKTIVGTNINSYKDGNLTFTLSYNDYGSEGYLNDGFVSISAIADFSSDNTTYYDVNGNLITSSSYDLNNGLYDSNGSTIKNIVVNNTSFSFKYNDDRTCADMIVNYTVMNSNNFKYVNFSTNDDYYSKAGIIIRNVSYDLYNGLYDENHNPITDATIDGIKYKLTYDTNGDCTSVYATIYHRTPTQQTTFYDVSGNVVTIYVQTYSFEVPGIYKPKHFNYYINSNGEFSEINMSGEELNTNYPNSFDLYQTLIDIYGQYNGTYTDEEDNVYKYPRGYKEINGNKYFLLVSALENAKILAMPLDDGGGVKKDVNDNIIPLDCEGKEINLKSLELLPVIDKIYIDNAILSKEDKISWNASNYDASTITSNTELPSAEDNNKKIKIYATNTNNVIIDTDELEYEGINYTKRIKLNGTGSLSVSAGVVSAYRAIEIPVNSGTNLITTYFASNDNEIRELAFAEVVGNNINIVGYLLADKNNLTMDRIIYEGSSASLFIYSLNGEVNIYNIEVANTLDFSLNNSTIKKTLTDLELTRIKGLFYQELDFSSYEMLEKLIIKNSNISFMPKIYRKLTHLDLSNNRIKDISNISTGVYLEYVDLSYNNIETFNSMRFMTTLKNLYVAGNVVNKGLKFPDSKIVYPYGTPRKENGVIYGEINVSNFVQIFENNKYLTNQTNFDIYDFLYGKNSSSIFGNNDDYLEAAFIANSVSYMNKFENGLILDLGLVTKLAYLKNNKQDGSNYYVGKTYASKDSISYDLLPSGTSDYYYEVSTGVYHYFNDSKFVTADKDYKYAIFTITIQNDPSKPENTFTIYREIYFEIA